MPLFSDELIWNARLIPRSRQPLDSNHNAKERRCGMNYLSPLYCLRFGKVQQYRVENRVTMELIITERLTFPVPAKNEEAEERGESR